MRDENSLNTMKTIEENENENLINSSKLIDIVEQTHTHLIAHFDDLNHPDLLIKSDLIWSNKKLKVESSIRLSIENYSNSKPHNTMDSNINLTFEDYSKENLELKKTNEILEREINLLKSLILINNLNLNTNDFKPCKYNIKNLF
jgi:hypothetical protein